MVRFLLHRVLPYFLDLTHGLVQETQAISEYRRADGACTVTELIIFILK